MAVYGFLNIRASQALPGQSVRVTVNPSAIPAMQDIADEDAASSSTGQTGVVRMVDYYGNSFQVMPIQPNTCFGVYGYLPSGATVTVTYT